MLNDLLDLAGYAFAWLLIGASLFTGVFLSVAGYYFITDKIKGE